MPTSKVKWAKHVHTRGGALAGWCERCPVAKRHTALRRVARTDGYAVVDRRLGFLRNVANRRTNAKLERIAAMDLRWAQKHLRPSVT
jgi:hypothetical protein